MINKIDTSDALQSLKPSAQWVLRGEELEWLDTEQTQPTTIEISDEVVRLQAEYDGLEYSRTRASEYLPIGDQLDMQYKDLINGTSTWKDHIAKVKSDNPKG